MFPQYIVGQKIVTGFMALLVFLNVNWIGNDIPDIKAEIYNHHEKIDYVVFYGTFIVDGEEFPMIVSVSGDEKTTNINKKEEINKKEDKTTNERKKINEDKSIKEDKNIKEKKESISRNINNQETTNIKDDRTPGRMKIKIKTRHGDVVEIDDDLGSGSRSEFEQECKKEIISEVKDYLAEIKNEMRNSNTSLWNKINKTINGFYGYVNEDNKAKSKFRLPWFR